MTIDERALDEVIQHAREVAEIQRNNDKLNKTLGKAVHIIIRIALNVPKNTNSLRNGWKN